MRVPTLATAQAAFAGIEARQAEQARLQTMMGSGLRVNSPGDDPVAAAQAEMARSRLAHLKQDARGAQLATSLLQAADGALGQGIELMQVVRESLVAAGDGAYSAADRASLAMKLRAARDEMVSVANTRDGAGGFVFGGQGSTTEPLAGGVAPVLGTAAGTQGMGPQGRFMATVDARAAFMALPQGNGVFATASGTGNTGAGWIDTGSVANPTQLTGHNYSVIIGGAPGSLTFSVTDITAGTTVLAPAPYSPGTPVTVDGQKFTVSGTPAPGDTFAVAPPAAPQSVFNVIDDAIAFLEAPYSAGSYAEQLDRSQAGMDRALESLTLMRTRVGQEMTGVDTAVAVNSQDALLATQRSSDLVDLDILDAISRIQNNQTGLEAALKTYSTLGRTSLFQMIS